MITEDKILDISENYYDYLMNLENVVGIGLGYKYINKINTSEPCIHVLVEKKLDEKHVSTKNLIPKTYMGIKTDVVQTGRFCTYASKHALPQRVRPLQGGFSISPNFKEVGTGTIGCIVTRKVKNERTFYILSNNHVLANGNIVPIGTPILQPGKSNYADPKHDIVAYLSEFIPVQFKNKYTSPTNYVDCAIARVATRKLISNEIFIAGKIKGISKPKINLPVKKIGMASGISYGKIVTMGVTVNVDFGKNRIGKFKRQIATSLFTKAGDSGSIVLNDNNEVIGLFFTASGDNASDYSIFSDIKMVLDALKVSIFIG